MSDGLNKEFMGNPLKFMHLEVIDIPLFLQKNGTPNSLTSADQYGLCPVKPDLYDFDLEYNPKVNCVDLVLFGDRMRASDGDKPIKAYWLPWIAKSTGPGCGLAQVTFEVLNQTGVKFLFTSALGECRAVITKTSFNHIAGGAGQTFREQTTTEVAGGQRGRAFSSTTGNKYGALAFIAGFKAGKVFKGWHFVAQSMNVNDVGMRSVGRVWSNNQLYEFPKSS